MKTRPLWNSRVVGLVLFGAALGGVVAAMAEEFTAVSARAAKEYVRTRLPNGTFTPETYAFGRGGSWSGDVTDLTFDKIDFREIAQVIAGPLRDQSFVPSADPNNTKLLIMVYWGTTRTPEHVSGSAAHANLASASTQLNARGMEMGVNYVSKPNAVFKDPTGVAQALDSELTSAMAVVALENHQRDRLDRENAAMLGYDSWWEAVGDATPATTLGLRRQDMIDELESDRYFVILMAYDFRLMWKEKKHQLLWETRLSIRARGNAFDKQLAAMVLGASKYFGKDSKGLVHDPVPEGKVEIGDLKSLGTAPADK